MKKTGFLRLKRLLKRRIWLLPDMDPAGVCVFLPAAEQHRVSAPSPAICPVMKYAFFIVDFPFLCILFFKAA